MHIALDYTTGIYPGAGVARYTRSLVDALARLDGRNRYSLFYAARGLPVGTPEEKLAGELFARHPNFRRVPVPLSVRHMFAVWQRLRLPVPADLFTGRCDVLHSPDFVSPPHRSGVDIITVHDVSFMVVPECAEPKLAAFLGKTVPRAVERADKIIAVSHQTKRDLVRLLGVPDEKVSVVHNGIDARAWNFDAATIKKDGEKLRAKMGLPGRFILHVGTLEPRKNLVRLIEAYEEAVRGLGGEDVALVLAGRKGWMYEPILAAAERVNASGSRVRVIFVDYVDDGDLPLLYNMAEVFAYPSLYEGFGLPVAEAMMSGTPTLVSGDGALEEVAGDAAVRVEATSVESIADGLRRMLTDEGLRGRLRMEGPLQVQGFTWDAAAEKVLALYGSVVGSR
jgi:glycosyltransferase involved in cell wall biosynthesis